MPPTNSWNRTGRAGVPVRQVTVRRHLEGAYRDSGEQRGHPGDVAVLLAGAVGIAQDDLVDPPWFKVRHLG
jgi:hypothetical protein